jgi:hypothetical protein
MAKNPYAIIILFSLLLVVYFQGRSEGAPEQNRTGEWNRWNNTVYYRNTFSADIEWEALLRVAAVDSYEVYFNGTLVGADSVSTRMQGYPITVVKGNNKNQVGVKVANRGRGEGNGLLAAVVVAVEDTTFAEIDSFLVTSTTDRSQHTWFWTAELQEGTEWTTETKLERNDAWQIVQTGSADKDRIEELADPSLEVIAGFPGGIDVGSVAGRLLLKQIRGENLALDKASFGQISPVGAFDGDLNTSWNPPVNALNFTAGVDLRVRRNIHTIRAITLKKGNVVKNSLKGYSVQISDDQLRWSEVAVLHDIVQFDRTTVSFTPTFTRYVRIAVVNIDAINKPKVAEIEVIGSGFTDRGTFLSQPQHLGAPDSTKNFGRVTWEATVPKRTELFVQFRTGDELADFDDSERGWSEPFETGDISYPSPEPGRLFQYLVTMVTRDGTQTPEFRGIQLDYSSTDIPVSGARGRIAPNRVPMGVDTLFVYTLEMDFSPGDQGVEKLYIDVPSEARLDLSGDLDGRVKEWQSTHRELRLTFTEPLNDVSQLVIPFQARSYANVHEFRAFLFSPGSENPLNVEQNADSDPTLEDGVYSWSTITTTSTDNALTEARANPEVFTPNGDGINDATNIGFILSKAEIPRAVTIQIFDLSGRIVRDLKPEPLVAGSYLNSSGAGAGRASPGYWDGTDAAGKVVSPGLYLYRIEVDLDTGDEVQSGVVAVVY